MTPHTFIFIGRSGCGKGTQVELLKRHLDKDGASTFHLESGARFRNFIEGDSRTSALSRDIYAKGEIQPVFLSVWMWSNIMVENLTGAEHLVLDGTPRHREEVDVLDSAFGFYGRDEVHVIHLDISRETAIERMSGRGRSDDRTEESVTRRLDWYETHVAPTIERLASLPRYRYHKIDGERTPEEIFADIIERVGIKD